MKRQLHSCEDETLGMLFPSGGFEQNGVASLLGNQPLDLATFGDWCPEVEPRYRGEGLRRKT